LLQVARNGFGAAIHRRGVNDSPATSEELAHYWQQRVTGGNVVADIKGSRRAEADYGYGLAAGGYAADPAFWCREYHARRHSGQNAGAEEVSAIHKHESMIA
jgi:hypothetical protein